MKKVIMRILKVLAVAIIAGFIFWITVGLYRFIKNKLKGS